LVLGTTSKYLRLPVAMLRLFYFFQRIPVSWSGFAFRYLVFGYHVKWQNALDCGASSWNVDRPSFVAGSNATLCIWKSV